MVWHPYIRRVKAAQGLRSGALIACLLGPAAWAEVPRALEPDYAEAVLSFNAREYSKTLKQLDALIARDPKVNEFLELKALSLKVTQKDGEAEKVYLELIRNKKSQKRAPAELAPYHFELAMILSRRKQHEEARPYFNFAIRHGFNRAPAHLYVGMGEFNSGRWSEAAGHFREVVDEGAGDLKPIAHFYLGQTYLKMEYPAGGTANLIEARASARALIADASTDPETRSIAEKIFASTEAALSPYDNGRFFGYIGTLSGYDSNILLVPGTVSSAAETSGKATFKQTVMGAAGYATSSTSFLQLVPSVRSSFNYNMNRDSRSSQFATATGSLFINRSPLAPFSYGLRIEGSLVFRTDVDPATNGSTYRLFSTNASAGPYLRFQATRELQFNLEGTLEPRKYENDPTNEQRRSGTGYQLRASVQNERGSRFLNPAIFARYGADGAEGSEYASTSWGGDFSNVMHLSQQVDLTGILSASRQTYAKRSSGVRQDTLLIAQANLAWKWKPKWMVIGNTAITKNASSLETTYAYDRMEFSAGVTYSF